MPQPRQHSLRKTVLRALCPGRSRPVFEPLGAIHAIDPRHCQLSGDPAGVVRHIGNSQDQTMLA